MAARPIVVTGATGMQGGAVARALLDKGVAVRALTRDSGSDAACALRRAGATLCEADFEDREGLARAMEGASGVFSVQYPPAKKDPDSELRSAVNLMETAKAAGVETFVQTTVARAGEHESFVGWDDGRWEQLYWTSKAKVEEAVKAAGFARWTILKPAHFMENFLPPKAAMLYPSLSDGRLDTAMTPDASINLLSARDLASFATVAFLEHGRLDCREIPIAGEALAMDEIAQRISGATGKEVTARYMSVEEAIASGMARVVAERQVWASAEGHKIDHAAVRDFGIPLDTFANWAQRHADEFDIRA